MTIRPARQWKFYCGLKGQNGEHVNGEKYMVAMKSIFPAFTLTMSHGVWKGVEEPCMVFTVIDMDNVLPCKGAIEVAAELLKKQGNQESILVVREAVEAALV